jgi:hypothetical protein
MDNRYQGSEQGVVLKIATRMSKPKLKNRKRVVLPKGTTTLEISFRTVSRKGKIKTII